MESSFQNIVFIEAAAEQIIDNYFPQKSAKARKRKIKDVSRYMLDMLIPNADDIKKLLPPLTDVEVVMTRADVVRIYCAAMKEIAERRGSSNIRSLKSELPPLEMYHRHPMFFDLMSPKSPLFQDAEKACSLIQEHYHCRAPGETPLTRVSNKKYVEDKEQTSPQTQDERKPQQKPVKDKVAPCERRRERLEKTATVSKPKSQLIPAKKSTSEVSIQSDCICGTRCKDPFWTEAKEKKQRKGKVTFLKTTNTKYEIKGSKKHEENPLKDDALREELDTTVLEMWERKLKYSHICRKKSESNH